MNFVEFIGFFISLIVLGILAVKKRREQKLMRENPEEYAKQQMKHEQELRKLFRELKHESGYDDDDEDEEEERQVVHKRVHQAPSPPPPPPVHIAKQKPLAKSYVQPVIAENKFEARLDQRSAISERRFEASLNQSYKQVDKSYVKKIEMPSRAKYLIQNLPYRQQMIILHEIFSPPKGL